MFSVFNNYNSILSNLYKFIILVFSYYYLMMMGGILLVFFSYRLPYCYSPYLFLVLLLMMVFKSFMSLFFRRLSINMNEFFSGFMPVGTPVYMCPLVCMAETMSYMIRPIVLVLRPFINISLGCYGAVGLCKMCFLNYAWFVVLGFLFFYEVFVAMVHWYIVTSMLSFSIDH